MFCVSRQKKLYDYLSLSDIATSTEIALAAELDAKFMHAVAQGVLLGDPAAGDHIHLPGGDGRRRSGRRDPCRS